MIPQVLAHAVAALSDADADNHFPPSVEDFYSAGAVRPAVLPVADQVHAAGLARGRRSSSCSSWSAYRNPKMVPAKWQWMAESIYGFARNNIAVEMIGARGRAVRAVLHDAVQLHPADEPLRHRPVHPDLAELAHRVPDHPRGDQLRDVQLRRHPQARLRQVHEALADPAGAVVHPAAADPDRVRLDLHRPAVHAGRCVSSPTCSPAT